MDFGSLYKQYINKIFRFTYYYTKNHHEQEDLVQDIFYNILTGLKNFKALSSLNTYIYSIARNTCLNYIKNNIRERNKIDKLRHFHDEKYCDGPFEQIVLKDEVKYFFEILDMLPEESREVFYMSEVENMKYKEISRITGLPEGTIKSRISRSKEKIMEIIDKKEASNG